MNSSSETARPVGSLVDDEELARRQRRQRSRRAALWVSSTLAATIPTGLAWFVDSRVAEVSASLSNLTEVPCRIGNVEASLSGSVRLSDVEVGEMFHADGVEAAVSLRSLLSGQLGADEIRVERPRVRARVAVDGQLDVAHVLRRIAARRPSEPSRVASRRLRRVIVTEGELEANVDGLGRIAASSVELLPEPDGVRVITGKVHATGEASGLSLNGSFERIGADLRITDGSVTRLLAVGGDTTIRDKSGASLRVTGMSLSRGVASDPSVVWIKGDALDAGVPRPLMLAIVPSGNRSAWLTTEGLPLTAFASIAPTSIDLTHARFRGSVGLSRQAEPAAIRVALDGDLDGALWNDADVAATAIPLDGGATLSAEFASQGVTLTSAEFRRGAATLFASGSLQTKAGRVSAADVSLSLRSTGCLQLLESLPAPMRGSLDGLTLAGELSASGHLTFANDKPVGDAVSLSLDIPSNDCTVVFDAPGADPRALRERRKHLFPDGSTAEVGPGSPGWVDLATLPSYVGGAFVAAEDDEFFTHHGFNLTQIGRSLEVDLRQHELARGGSTISQQLVKNVFLSHRRSFDRKLQEAVLTWRVEATASKVEILSYYLNIIELGPNVFGIRAAAKFWFGIEPAVLSPRQVAFLAALTPEPKSWYRRVIAAKGLDPQSAARVEQVLRQMKRTRAISKPVYDAARTGPLWLEPSAIRPKAN